MVVVVVDEEEEEGAGPVVSKVVEAAEVQVVGCQVAQAGSHLVLSHHLQDLASVARQNPYRPMVQVEVLPLPYPQERLSPED